MASSPPIILGIESSCDETSAAVIRGTHLLSNIIATQDTIHRFYGGVVPELASRAHQQKIIPVVHEALSVANIAKSDLGGIAFTRGPGLMGALLVGVSFAKSMAMALDIPLVEVNHMQGHVLAHFIDADRDKEQPHPSFPFLCLTVSGGHTQIVRVNDYLDMHVIGETTDDAAGEAFDKAAKILGLPYPGGIWIDRHAAKGNSRAFRFPHPQSPGLNFSFSGLKTAFLNFLKEKTASNAGFAKQNMDDMCASYQQTIVDILMHKLVMASDQTGITEIAVSGGVSANSGLRKTLIDTGKQRGWNTWIAPLPFCTDNAAMIAIAGYYKYCAGDFADQRITPVARMPF